MAREAMDAKDRPLGPRALRTRRRLLDTTAALLAERGLRGLSVVEIARRAETSPATFYQYFGDVEAAALALAEESTEELAALLERMPTSLAGPEGLERARGFVREFADLWDRHHAVLRVRDHAAEEGDRRFRSVRRKALRPLLDRLADLLGAPRRVEGGLHPYAAAAALATVLESLSAYHGELAVFGADRDALVETSARMLVDVVETFRVSGGR